MFFKLKDLIPNKILLNIYLIFSMFFVSMFFEAISLISIIPSLQIISKSVDTNSFINSLGVFSFDVNFSYNQWIIILVACLGIIFTLKAIFLTFFSYKFQQLVKNIKIYFPDLLFKKYIDKNFKFHADNNSSYLIRNITETEHIATYLKSLIILLHEGIIFFGLVIILLIYSPIVTIILATTLIPITIIFFVIIKKKSRQWGEERIFNLGERFKNLQEGLKGIKDIKIFKKEEIFKSKFKINTTQMNNAEMKQNLVESMPRYWIEWLLVLAFLTLITSSLILGTENKKTLTLVILFAMAGYRAMPSLLKIMQSYQSLIFVKPVLNLVFNDLKEKNYSFKNSKKIPLNFDNKLSIKDLAFSYDNKTIFKNLNFEIKKGSAVGIVGESGVGKTTLVNILLGLLKPSNGKIILDQEEISKDLYEFPNLFGYVPQDLFLLDSTIKNNVAFTLDQKNIDEKKVLYSLSQAKLKNLIENNGLGINTIVGEQGIKLSGGQKQRLGIARALYSDAKILIFDEATSNLDTETENEIIKELAKLKKIITIVIISHRQSTLNFCDELYKITTENIKKIK